MSILDKLSEYFDIEVDNSYDFPHKTYYIKDGYLLRYEGFDEFNLRIFTVDADGFVFMTEDADWNESISKGMATLEECKLYKLEAIKL